MPIRNERLLKQCRRGINTEGKQSKRSAPGMKGRSLNLESKVRKRTLDINKE